VSSVFFCTQYASVACLRVYSFVVTVFFVHRTGISATVRREILRSAASPTGLLPFWWNGL